MADYDRRNNGPRGNFNNRKRRYRDEDDDYDRRPQRRRYEEPLPVKLRKQLLSIAESAVRKTEEDVASVAQIVTENYENEDLRASFTDLVIQLVTEQPFKIPFVAAIVLLVNSQKPEVTTEILTKAGEAAEKYVEQGSWRDVKLVLRFLGCIQGIFEGDGVFTILEELFSRAFDLQTSSSEDSLGLELVKIILFTIPYVMASSAQGLDDQASALLEKTDVIASTPHALEVLVDPFICPDPDQPTKTQSALGLLQKQLQDEAKNGWELFCIPRPWKSFPEGDASDPLESATKHAFPTILVPDPVKTGPRAIFPEVYFSVYSDQEVQTVPPTSDIASSLLRDSLVDTINILDYNRNATAKFLIDVDCYFALNTFVKRATPFDKLRDVAGDRSTWKPEDVAVDAVFSQLFQLPAPEHKLVYYHAVLTESCKIAPAAIAPSLGRAIRQLYRNVDVMDLDLGHRFMDWFAHHLSNFGFTWKWIEWVDDIELPNVHPKKAFIIGALDKEIRLSFAQRVKGTLPEPYQPLISEAKEKDIPDFKYTQDTTPFATEGREIMALIRKKAPDSEIQPLLSSIESGASTTTAEPDPLIQSTDAYVTSICYIGSKSLSHVLSCIERCKERLLAIGPKSSAARRQVITSVMDYWRDQPGVGVNIIDKLLNYTILTPMSVIEWVLVDHVDRGTILARAYVYEMVASTVGKVTNRVRQIVAARNQAGLPGEQVQLLEETLERERGDMRNMFKIIEDALVGIANGSNDEMMENGDGEGEYERLIREWGKRWLRVFQRKMGVEEAYITEAMTVKVEAVDGHANGLAKVADEWE